MCRTIEPLGEPGAAPPSDLRRRCIEEVARMAPPARVAIVRPRWKASRMEGPADVRFGPHLRMMACARTTPLAICASSPEESVSGMDNARISENLHIGGDFHPPGSGGQESASVRKRSWPLALRIASNPAIQANMLQKVLPAIPPVASGVHSILEAPRAINANPVPLESNIACHRAGDVPGGDIFHLSTPSLKGLRRPGYQLRMAYRIG